MAVDEVYNYVTDFIKGIITRAAFWELVKFRYPTHQISFHIKLLIELATSYDEADSVIQQYSGFDSYEEKVAYLKGKFDCQIVGRSVGDNARTDYIALLTSIVNYRLTAQPCI